jgi:hypothetical protein
VTATGWLQTGETENDRIMNLKKLLNLGAIALSLACLPAYAQTMYNTYADGDLILDFSKWAPHMTWRLTSAILPA